MKRSGSALAAAVLLSAGTAFAAGEAAKDMKAYPKPTPEHKKLEYFVGEWTAEGDMKPNPFMPTGGKVSTKDSCKWFEGGYSVVCHSSGKSPMGNTKALFIMGYSPEAKAYTYYGVDSSPMVMMSIPRGTIQGDTWTYTGEDTLEGKTYKSRYTIKVLSKTAYTFSWDMEGEPGKWDTVMTGKSTKEVDCADSPLRAECGSGERPRERATASYGRGPWVRRRRRSSRRWRPSGCSRSTRAGSSPARRSRRACPARSIRGRHRARGSRPA